MKKTVKSREHHGADSLDLTIPTKIVKEYDINPGDIFEITEYKDDDTLVLKYKRIYEKSE